VEYFFYKEVNKLGSAKCTLYYRNYHSSIPLKKVICVRYVLLINSLCYNYDLASFSILYIGLVFTSHENRWCHFTDNKSCQIIESILKYKSAETTMHCKVTCILYKTQAHFSQLFCLQVRSVTPWQSHDRKSRCLRDRRHSSILYSPSGFLTSFIRYPSRFDQTKCLTLFGTNYLFFNKKIHAVVR
jgi:hypothetical protein